MPSLTSYAARGENFPRGSDRRELLKMLHALAPATRWRSRIDRSARRPLYLGRDLIRMRTAEGRGRVQKSTGREGQCSFGSARSCFPSTVAAHGLGALSLRLGSRRVLPRHGYPVTGIESKEDNRPSDVGGKLPIVVSRSARSREPR